MRRLALALVLLLAVAPVFAQVADPTPLAFRDAAEEARFRALSSELRCVKCQNQSLADSDAPIAHDLRQQVLHLMRDGRSDEEVKAYLVERYGEFVLYAPPVHPSTWLLWFGPLLLLAGGGIFIAVVVRGRARALPADVAGSGPVSSNETSDRESDQEW